MPFFFFLSLSLTLSVVPLDRSPFSPKPSPPILVHYQQGSAGLLHVVAFCPPLLAPGDKAEWMWREWRILLAFWILLVMLR